MINTVKKIYVDDEFRYYKITTNNNLELHVPLDPANRDYQDIQQWIADGNSVIDPNAE